MSFFCIIGALLCLPPANAQPAWNYADYYHPVYLTTVAHQRPAMDAYRHIKLI